MTDNEFVKSEPVGAEELITQTSHKIENNETEILAGGFEFDQDSINDKSNSSSIGIIDEEQEGGAAATLVEYKINYLVPDDEQLVNVDKIKSAVKKYIENYNSDAMKKYKQLFKTVYQKYSSKRYTIDNNDNEIIVSKSSDGTSKIGKRDIVFEISKPEYIFYNKDSNLIHMKNKISNKRIDLQIHYQSLVNKLNVQPEEKKKFEKERKNFIDLLERYYIYNLYHQQINNIVLDGKSNIIIQELHGFLKDNAEKKYALDSDLYKIDNTLVDRINTNNSIRLNLYNELIVKLQGAKSTLSSSIEKEDKTSNDKKEKIINEIKEYLKSNDEYTTLNNEIKDAVRVQNTYIDYIISRVPNN